MAKQTFTVGQVLTAAQLTSLQQTAMLGGSASAKTASYTLVAADAGTAISMTSTSATTITVNTGLFAAGDTVQITNLGSGVTTITAGTATVNTSASLALAQYESGTLDFTSTSAAIFIKGAGAAASASGLTKIVSASFSSAASVQISNCFTSTYKNYYIILDDLGHSVGGDDVYMKFMRSTNTVYSSDYFYGGASYNSSGSSYNWSGNSDTKIILGKVATNNRHQFHINVGNVGNSNEDPSYQAAGNGSINGYSIVGGMLNTTSYTFTGLEFSGVGNLTGNYTVFGLAK